MLSQASAAGSIELVLVILCGILGLVGFVHYQRLALEFANYRESDLGLKEVVVKLEGESTENTSNIDVGTTTTLDSVLICTGEKVLPDPVTEPLA